MFSSRPLQTPGPIHHPFFPSQPQNTPRRREFSQANSTSSGGMPSSFASALPYDSSEYVVPWSPVANASNMNGYPPPAPPLPLPLPRHLASPPPPLNMNSSFQQFPPPLPPLPPPLPPPSNSNFTSPNSGFPHQPLSPFNSPPLPPVGPHMPSNNGNSFGPPHPPTNHGQHHMPPPPLPFHNIHSMPPPAMSPLGNRNYNHHNHQIPPPPNFSIAMPNNSFLSPGNGPGHNGPNQGNHTYMTSPVSAPGSPSPRSNQIGYCNTTPPPVGTQALSPLILSPSLPMEQPLPFSQRLGLPTHGPVSHGPPMFPTTPTSHPKTGVPRQTSTTPSPTLSQNSSVSSGQSSSASQSSPVCSSPKPKLNPNANAFTPVIKSPAIVSSTPPPKASNMVAFSRFGNPATPPPKLKSPLNPFSTSFAQSQRTPPKFNPGAPEFVPHSDAPPSPPKSPPAGRSAPARTAPPPTGPAASRFSKLSLLPSTELSSHRSSLPPRPNIGGLNIFEERGLPLTTPTGPKAMSIPTGPKAMSSPTGPRSMTPRAMTPSGPRAQASNGTLGSKYAPQIDLTGLKKAPPIAPAAMLTPTGKLPPSAPAAMLSRITGSRRGFATRSGASSIRAVSTHGARTPSESGRSTNGDARQESREEIVEQPQETQEEERENVVLEEVEIAPATELAEEIPVAEIRLEEEPKYAEAEEVEDVKQNLVDEPAEVIPVNDEDSESRTTSDETLVADAEDEAPPVVVKDSDEVPKAVLPHEEEQLKEDEVPVSLAEELVVKQPIEVENAQDQRPITPIPPQMLVSVLANELETNEGNATAQVDQVVVTEKAADVVPELNHNVAEPLLPDIKTDKEEVKINEKEMNRVEETGKSTIETNDIYKDSLEFKPAAPKPSPDSILNTRQKKPKNQQKNRRRKAKAILESKPAPAPLPELPASPEVEEEDGAPHKKAKNRMARVVDDCIVDSEFDQSKITGDILGFFNKPDESALPITEAVIVPLGMPDLSPKLEATLEDEERKRSPATLEEQDHEREYDGGVKLDLIQEAPTDTVAEAELVQVGTAEEAKAEGQDKPAAEPEPARTEPTQAADDASADQEPNPILAQLVELLEPCFIVVGETKSAEAIAKEKVLEPRESEEESVTSIDSIIDLLSGCENITSLSRSLERLSKQSKPGSPEAKLFAQLQRSAVSSVPIEEDKSDSWSTKSGRSIRKVLRKSFSKATSYPQILSSTKCKIKAILPPFLTLSSTTPVSTISAATLPTPPPTAPSESLLKQKTTRPRLYPRVTMSLLTSSWLQRSRRSSVAVDCH